MNARTALILALVAMLAGGVGGYAIGRGVERSETPAQASETAPSRTPPPTGTRLDADTIYDVLGTNPGFSMLDTLLRTSGYSHRLDREGPYTVFAPTNEAFTILDSGTVETLLLEDNRERLDSLIGYHIVQGRYTLDELSEGMTLTTIQGERLAVRRDGARVLVDNAIVQTPDITTGNGNIHIIDAVLMPEAAKPTTP